MTRKIFRSILLAAAVALLASLATVMGILYPYFSDLQEGELGEELKLTASAVEQGSLDYLETLAPGTVRVTWVAGDGTVLYDSEADPASMENHADRREIRDALARARTAAPPPRCWRRPCTGPSAWGTAPFSVSPPAGPPWPGSCWGRCSPFS